MTRRVSSLVLVLWLIQISPCFASQEEDTAGSIRRVAHSLDEMLDLNKREIVQFGSGNKKTRVKAKPLNRRSLVPVLSFILNMDQPMLEKAFIEKKMDLSAIIFARHISDKKNQPFENFVVQKTFDEWMADLKAAEVPLKQVQESLDHVYMEVSFRALDERMK